VAGSTEAISQTLAGQVSNLDDAWTQLLNTIGKGNEGVLSNAVNLLSKALSQANELLKSDLQRFEEIQSKILAKETEGFEALAKAMGDTGKAQVIEERHRLQQLQVLEDKFIKIRDRRDALKGGLLGPTGEESILKQRLTEQLDVIRMQIEVYSTDLPKAIQETIAKINEQANKQEKQIGIVDRLQQKIEDLNKQIKDTTNIGDLGPGGRLIKQLEIAKAQLADLMREHKDIPKSLEIKEIKPKKDAVKDFQTKVETELGPVGIKITPHLKDDGSGALAEAFQNAKKDIEQQGVSIFADSLNSNIDLEVNSYKTRLDNLQGFYDKQIELAGDNERAKKELEVKREQESSEIRRQIFEKEKRAKRSHVIIDTAASITKTAANLGYPAAIPYILLATIQGLQQLNAINRETPRFAKGVLNLKGPGHRNK
jgi:hypothetical protein